MQYNIFNLYTSVSMQQIYFCHSKSSIYVPVHDEAQGFHVQLNFVNTFGLQIVKPYLIPVHVC